MIGIDTNILVRYIVQDDPKQSNKATHFIESHCSLATPGFINSIVLCELVWVLESAYEYAREDIAKVIEMILRTRQFHIQEPELMWRSLQGYREKTVDFSDHYITHANVLHGCEYTITFDKKAARLDHAQLLMIADALIL
jgi:predicted nucleic-acid-binding protein